MLDEGYERSSLTEVEAVLDSLSPASSEQVYSQTLGMSPRAVAAVAASRADAGGGGGGGQVVSCLVGNEAGVDAHTSGVTPVVWDALYDNAVDFGTLGAIPAGLGLTFVFDGSSANITTTEAGVWSLAMSYSRNADATWTGSADLGLFRPTIWPSVTASGGQPLLVTDIIALPDGATFAPKVTTADNATANPYLVTAYLAICRLA